MLSLLKKKILFTNLNIQNKNIKYNLENNFFQLYFFKSFVFLLFNNYKNLDFLIFLFFYFYNFIYLYYLNLTFKFKFLKKILIFNLINFEFNFLRKIKLKKNILDLNIFFKSEIFNFYNIYIYNKLIFIINRSLLTFVKKNKNQKKDCYKNILMDNNYINKILEIKRISHTREKGRIRKFKIIFVFGNKTGWLGVGIGSSLTISGSILKAKKRSFKNIKYLNLTKSKTVSNFISSKFKTTTIILKPIYLWGGLKAPLFIKSLLYIFGCKNMWITVLGSSNKLNILNSFFLGIENFLSKKEFFNITFLFYNKIEKELEIGYLVNLFINFI